tara:strand:+ start:285 stop:407 length:123 start_codon:yes stop_codon:yes gene_type:complete
VKALLSPPFDLGSNIVERVGPSYTPGVQPGRQAHREELFR